MSLRMCFVSDAFDGGKLCKRNSSIEEVWIFRNSTETRINNDSQYAGNILNLHAPTPESNAWITWIDEKK